MRPKNIEDSVHNKMIEDVVHEEIEIEIQEIMSSFEKLINEKYGVKVKREEGKENEEIKRLRHENEVLRKMQKTAGKEVVEVTREPSLVSEEEIKEHIRNVG